MYNFTFIILILYILFLTYNKHIYLSVHVNIYTETRMLRVNGEKKPERWIVGPCLIHLLVLNLVLIRVVRI